MKTIAQAIANTLGLSFIYARSHEANITLDTTTMPAMILQETISGQMLLEGNSVWQNNSYVVEFINLADMQDSSDNNDVIMQAMIVKAVSFIKTLNISTSINEKIASYEWEKVQENVYDINAIGVRLTFTAKINPTTQCD